MTPPFKIGGVAETTGVYWARNFTLSTCSFRGRLAILSSSIGAGLEGQRACLAGPPQAKPREDRDLQG